MIFKVQVPIYQVFSTTTKKDFLNNNINNKNKRLFKTRRKSLHIYYLLTITFSFSALWMASVITLTAIMGVQYGECRSRQQLQHTEDIEVLPLTARSWPNPTIENQLGNNIQHVTFKKYTAFR